MRTALEERGKIIFTSLPDCPCEAGASQSQGFPVIAGCLRCGIGCAGLMGMGKLTTHVLDTMHGRPAGGMGVRLLRDGVVLVSVVMNGDGRCDGPLLEGEALVPGGYELQFEVGEYFAGLGVLSPFLEVVPVRFRVEEGSSYHVPLVCSPFAYSTYRGS